MSGTQFSEPLPGPSGAHEMPQVEKSGRNPGIFREKRKRKRLSKAPDVLSLYLIQCMDGARPAPVYLNHDLNESPGGDPGRMGLLNTLFRPYFSNRGNAHPNTGGNSGGSGCSIQEGHNSRYK